MPESKTWQDIKKDYGYTKRHFGIKINFVRDRFTRTIIFRDVEQSYKLANAGYSKPTVILAGGVIEELLRQYLKHKNLLPKSDRFDDYIKICEEQGLLKTRINQLSDSFRQFRNLVHLSAEKDKKYSISKATAKAAVASIFTIVNDF